MTPYYQDSYYAMQGAGPEWLELGSSATPLESHTERACTLPCPDFLPETSSNTVPQAWDQQCWTGTFDVAESTQPSDEAFIHQEVGSTAQAPSGESEQYKWINMGQPIGFNPHSQFRPENPLPANKILSAVLSEKQPEAITSFCTWDTHLSPDTKVLGIYEERTGQASMFHLFQCAMSMLAHDKSHLHDKRGCSKQPVFAYGRLYQPSVSGRTRPVKLEQVAACCEEHQSAMRGMGLYPLPICEAHIEHTPGNSPNCQAVPPDESADLRKCYWLATTAIYRQTGLRVCSRLHADNSYSITSSQVCDPYWPNHRSAWKAYTPTQFTNPGSSLSKTHIGGATSLTFPRKHLIFLSESTGIGPTLNYRWEDRGLTVLANSMSGSEGANYGLHSNQESEIWISVYQRTSKCDHVLLHSITSSLGSKAASCQGGALCICRGPSHSSYHRATQCSLPNCNSVAFHIVGNRPFCTTHVS